MYTYFPEAKFGGFTDIDSTIRFYFRVNALLTPDSTVVDIGCGAGSYGKDPVESRLQLRILDAHCKHVNGLDIDEAALSNPLIRDIRLVGPDGKWPVENGTVHLCVSDWTLEHVEEPEKFYSEAFRVLRSDGYLCIRTSNVLHYPYLAARILPNRFHASILGFVQPRRDMADKFPTWYRSNSLWKIRSHIRKSGFRDHVIFAVGTEPAYLGFSRVAYCAGVFYQRIVPSFLQATILAFAKK